MIYKVHNKEKGFTSIDNNIFHNKNLSLQAKGLLCLMLSLSDNWDFNKKGLMSLSKHICENTFNKILEELKSEGHLTITQNGLDWQWDVFEIPDLKNALPITQIMIYHNMIVHNMIYHKMVVVIKYQIIKYQIIKYQIINLLVQHQKLKLHLQ